MRFPLPLFLLLLTWVLLSIAVGLKFYEWWRKRELSTMLRTAAEDPTGRGAQLLRDTAGRQTLVEIWLERLALLAKLQALLQQAGLAWTPGGLLMITAGGGIAGLVLAMLLPPGYWPWTALVLPALLAQLPLMLVRRKRNRRMAAFEEQFPEALDFLARSMRAGHAFTISLRMVSDESPEPLASEFRTVFNQQNLGAPLEAALYNLAERMPLLDVRFFVSAVVLQKQTGGNLGEILTRLSHVIRERFRLKGQVQAASAHGRTTATVLAIMPIGTTLLMMMVAPGYLLSMAHDRDGKFLIAGAIASQIFGQWVIRKIIRIKV